MTARKKDRKNARPVSTMLTMSEVAGIFNVHTGTIRRWSDRGVIKSYRQGPRGERRFRREDVAVLYLDRAIRKYMREKSA